ncbi:hypothetical protein WMY93_010114 [Mugilogobius chulae]|uniref:Ion transport domain-containing protein n=1 Tax=Mugilogobius chulae TaxID=88201 RepID=A0AAW0P6W0_9GOBI
MSRESVAVERGSPQQEPDETPGISFNTRSSRFYRWCQRLTSQWWNYIFATVVLMNCAAMAWFDPCRGRRSNLEFLDYAFFAFFLVEMIMKVFSLGFFGRNSYLDNNWNKLDLFTLFVELLGFILNSLNTDISWLPDFFRPFRLVSRMSSMLVFVEMLVETLPMFGNILLLCNFIILVFSVVGVQMWGGLLRNRCFLGENVTKYNVSLPPFYSDSDPLPYICAPPHSQGMRRCTDIPFYEQNNITCLVPPTSPTQTSWPRWTRTTVITLEGWSEIMYMVMDAFSFWSFIFFVLVTIIGAFVVMNVCAVVIATQFSESMERRHLDENTGPSTLQQLLDRTLQVCQRFSSHVPHFRRLASRVQKVWYPLRPKIHRFLLHKVSQRLLKWSVFLSVVIAAAEHHNQWLRTLNRTLNVSHRKADDFTVVNTVRGHEEKPATRDQTGVNTTLLACLYPDCSAR